MTFEEFFTKKRIDLTRLRHAKPDLFEEFRDHYAQMSEKSFDHTKKYWFNRLRKDFLLEVAETPKTVAEKTDTVNVTGTSIPDTVTKPAGLSSTSPSGFKPRFKSNVVKSSTADTPEGLQDDAVKPEKTAMDGTRPVGFKPRFRASSPAIASKKVENLTQDIKPAEPPSNAPTTDKKPAGLSSTSSPGFKPRFKPGLTGAKIEKASELPQSDHDSDKQPAQSVAQAKPLGFKPRFKAGVTPVKQSDGDEEPKQETSEPRSEPPKETTREPLGFKPRFKAGKTANKKDDDT